MNTGAFKVAWKWMWWLLLNCYNSNVLIRDGKGASIIFSKGKEEILKLSWKNKTHNKNWAVSQFSLCRWNALWETLLSQVDTRHICCALDKMGGARTRKPLSTLGSLIWTRFTSAREHKDQEVVCWDPTRVFKFTWLLWKYNSILKSLRIREF